MNHSVFDSITSVDSMIPEGVVDHELKIGACYTSLQWLKNHCKDGITMRQMFTLHPDWAGTIKIPIEVLERLIEGLATDSDPMMRYWAASVIFRVSAETQSKLVALAIDTDINVRHRMALSLVWLHVSVRDSVAIELCKNRDPVIVRRVKAALSRLSPETRTLLML